MRYLKNRHRSDAFETLFKEPRFDWEFIFAFCFFCFVIFCFTRMNPERFDHLLSLFHNSIKRTKIQIYKVITAGACLAITLRFLVSGEAQQSLSYSFCKGKSLKSPFFRRLEETQRFEEVGIFFTLSGLLRANNFESSVPS